MFLKTQLQPVEVTEKNINCGIFSKNIFDCDLKKKQLIVFYHIKHYIEDETFFY